MQLTNAKSGITISPDTSEEAHATNNGEACNADEEAARHAGLHPVAPAAARDAADHRGGGSALQHRLRPGVPPHRATDSQGLPAAAGEGRPRAESLAESRRVRCVPVACART